MTFPLFAPGINPGAPNAARVYDYLLGGEDHLAADREEAERLKKIAPGMELAARGNRDFLGRAVTYLARQGYTQFLDLGSGLPTMRHVHEVAREVHPHARVVCVDHDPMVISHGRALLQRSDGVGVVMVEGDLRDPVQILTDSAVENVLHLSRPVVALLVDVLHFVSDDDNPAQIVASLRDRMAPGSCLILSHACHETSPEVISKRRAGYVWGQTLIHPRPRAEIAAMLHGCVIHRPGLVEISTWRSRYEIASGVPKVPFLGAVADLQPTLAQLARPRSVAVTATARQ
ncbi:SAM-dependent methyltransferase [Nonomuraea sp. CA-141351]|uniref:SAM-dependent methyltransferase n=1 Tax=Nonomuraea sp. CA-141351 TaxID=3239996 RepID=UPI003D8DB209